MIIDVNAYLGPFAFRRLRHNTAGSLLKLMDAILKLLDKNRHTRLGAGRDRRRRLRGLCVIRGIRAG